MSVETIRELMREVQELRLKNARLMELAKQAKGRQDYWRERYYSMVHHEVEPDVPEFMKGLFK